VQPLTLSLSLWERGRLLNGAQRNSLSQGERAGVRGYDVGQSGGAFLITVFGALERRNDDAVCVDPIYRKSEMLLSRKDEVAAIYVLSPIL
jgi:hypothetical protein